MSLKRLFFFAFAVSLAAGQVSAEKESYTWYSFAFTD